MREKNKIRSFTDLDAWKQAHQLVLMVYKITKVFPRDETFSLTSQIRRAALSIVSNIAEGFSRQTYSDKIHFYIMAQGSNTELQSQLLVAKDLGYTQGTDFSQLAEQSIRVHKLINGLIKKSRSIRDS